MVSRCKSLSDAGIQLLMATGRHDTIADLLTVSAPRFEQLFTNQVMEMKRLVLQYIKKLQVRESAHGPAADSNDKQTLGTNTEGFPVLPAAFKLEECTKKVLEELYRQYLSQHYCEYNVYQ